MQHYARRIVHMSIALPGAQRPAPPPCAIRECQLGILVDRDRSFRPIVTGDSDLS